MYSTTSNKQKTIRIEFDDTIQFDLSPITKHICLFELLADQRNVLRKNFNECEMIINGNNFIRTEWSIAGFAIKDWMKHFLDIFGGPKIDIISFSGKGFNRTWFPRDLFRIFNAQSFYCVIDFILKILRSFQYPESLTTCKGKSLGRKPLNTIFILNFKSVKYYGRHQFQLTLNQLLAMNISTLKLLDSAISSKNLNFFLKHWLNGSNKRLEVLEIFGLNAYSPTIIFKNVAYQVILEDEIFSIYNEVFTFGYEIERSCDETRAAIFINSMPEVSHYCFRMIVGEVPNYLIIY